MHLSTAKIGSSLPIQGIPLDLFVDQVAEAAYLGPARLADTVGRYRPDWGSVRPWVRPRRGGYTRTLAYRDPRVEVLVLTWARGAEAPIHDHASQHCWMIAVRGTLEVIDYRRLGGTTGPGAARLEQLRPPRLLTAGEAESGTGQAEIHRVRLAPGVPLAVSVHVYARPIDRCLVFDLGRDRCSTKALSYDFLGPRPLSLVPSASLH